MIIDQLREFVADSGNHFPYNSWLSDDTMQVYVRKGRRYFNKRRINVLDIASVEVVQQGKGHFKRFLEHAIQLHPWDGIYVENVMDARFRGFFERLNWGQYLDSFFILWNETEP